jgi:hypothetical protein
MLTISTANAQAVPPTESECNSCAEWAFEEASTHHVDDGHAKKCLKTMAACLTQTLGEDNDSEPSPLIPASWPHCSHFTERDVEVAADKQPVKCKECATMLDTNSNVQHRDFADCVLLIERGRCPKEFPEGLFGLPSFNEIKTMESSSPPPSPSPSHLHHC